MGELSERAYKINGELLRQKMKEHGLSIKRLSSLSDISQKSIRSWLNGAPAYAKNIKIIAKFVGLNFEDLCERTNDSRQQQNPPLQMGYSIGLAIEDASNPELVRYFCRSVKGMMEGLARIKELEEISREVGVILYDTTKLDLYWKNGWHLVVMYATFPDTRREYKLVIIPRELIDDFLYHKLDFELINGENCLAVAAGNGRPEAGVRQKIKEHYKIDQRGRIIMSFNDISDHDVMNF